MIDKSVVKRLAEECGVTERFEFNFADEAQTDADFESLTKFANAIAAHQRDKDAALCEIGILFDSGRSDGKVFTYPRVAEAIRNQGEQK